MSSSGSVCAGIYSPKGITVPDPVQTICTRWGNDPFSYGSYSHVRVHSSGSHYDVLAESVGNRLFFAGEATSRKYPATMHGAFLSGLREASRILRAARDLQNISRKYTPRTVGLSSDLLVDLFRKPDLAFGNMLFIFDPSSNDPKSKGILKVTFGGKGSSSGDLENSKLGQLLNLYAIITRDEAHDLQQLSGKNDGRLSVLLKKLDFKLMGRNALGNLANSLISSVANARRSRGRNRLSAAQ